MAKRAAEITEETEELTNEGIETVAEILEEITEVEATSEEVGIYRVVHKKDTLDFEYCFTKKALSKFQRRSRPLND